MLVVLGTKSARSITSWMITNDLKRWHTGRYSPDRQCLNDEVRGAHRWIQVTLVESEELELNGSIVANCGYNYIDGDVDMVEYHVDASCVFEE